MSGRSVVTEGPAWALVLPEIQPASAQWSPERAEDLWLQKDEGRRRPEGEGVLLPEALGLIPGVRSAGRGALPSLRKQIWHRLWALPLSSPSPSGRGNPNVAPSGDPPSKSQAALSKPQS